MKQLQKKNNFLASHFILQILPQPSSQENNLGKFQYLLMHPTGKMDGHPGKLVRLLIFPSLKKKKQHNTKLQFIAEN